MYFWTRASRAILALGLLIGSGGCIDGGNASTEPKSSGAPAAFLRIAGPSRSVATPTVRAVVGPEGGSVVAANGARLDFPAGALAAPTLISLQPNDTLVGVELQPHGSTFPAGREPLLTLPLDGVEMRGRRHVQIVYVEDGQVRETLPSQLGPGKRTVSARLSHFSFYLGSGY